MSLASNATREFNKQISQALGSIVKVVLDTYDKYYVGTLIGFDSNSHSLCLEKVKDEKNNKYDKIFIRGTVWATLSIEGEPFPMEKLLERIRKIMPGETIRLNDDGKIYILGGKIIVSEKGVEGRGPTKDRVQKVYDEFVASLKSKKVR